MGKTYLQLSPVETLSDEMRDHVQPVSKCSCERCCNARLRRAVIQETPRTPRTPLLLKPARSPSTHLALSIPAPRARTYRSRDPVLNLSLGLPVPSWHLRLYLILPLARAWVLLQ